MPNSWEENDEKTRLSWRPFLGLGQKKMCCGKSATITALWMGKGRDHRKQLPPSFPPCRSLSTQLSVFCQFKSLLALLPYFPIPTSSFLIHQCSRGSLLPKSHSRDSPEEFWGNFSSAKFFHIFLFSQFFSFPSLTPNTLTEMHTLSHIIYSNPTLRLAMCYRPIHRCFPILPFLPTRVRVPFVPPIPFAVQCSLIAVGNAPPAGAMPTAAKR